MAILPWYNRFVETGCDSHRGPGQGRSCDDRKWAADLRCSQSTKINLARQCGVERLQNQSVEDSEETTTSQAVQITMLQAFERW